MDDPRTEAPELELSAHADEDGEDALQVTPNDSVSGFDLTAATGDAFAVASTPSEKPAASQPAPPKKMKQPVRLADDQFVAALLGQSRPESKKAKKPAAKPVNPAAEPVIQTPPPVIHIAPAAVPQPIATEPPVVEANAHVAVPPAAAEAASVAAGEPPPAAAVVIAPSPEQPKVIRQTKPAGPTVATAPVTTLEPEVLPELITAAATAPALPVAAVPVAAVPVDNIALHPIAVISGVDMAPVATLPPPRAPLNPDPHEEPPLAAQLQPPEMPVAIATEAAKPAPALARDLAIPVPTKAPAPSPRAKRELRIETKPAVLAASAPAVPMPATGAWWTLPLMFLGIAMIACALIVPVADDNHRAAYELAKIERDVAHFQQQADVNESFLGRVSTDPAMAERLAMRQLNMIRADEKFAPLKERHDPYGMSPFAMVSVEAPAPLPAYRPIGGFLSRWFLNPRCQTYFAGLGVLLVAAGVVFGGGGTKDAAAREALAAGGQTA